MSGTEDHFPSLKPGGHVCLPYSGEEEKHAAMAGFIQDGLLRGERCAYWGAPVGFAALLPHLEARGIPARALCERSALVFADSNPTRSFDLDQQTATLREAVAAARADGFTSLRIVGDPDASALSAIDPAQLAVFEAALSNLYGDVRATGLCAFDQRTTAAGALEIAMATHEVAIVEGRLCENPFFKASAPPPDDRRAGGRMAWMTESILARARASELLEAENAALIVESTRQAKRDQASRKHIATLTRSIEARDRLLITVARWLARPLPAMCGHLDELAKLGSLAKLRPTLESCEEHVAAIGRLSRGLDEIASFLQLQVVLRPERIDLLEVARIAIAELRAEGHGPSLDITLSGVEHIVGAWDRLRLTRLFVSLLQTAREHGYGARVSLKMDDLGPFARIRFEFMLPHAPALSDSGERDRCLAYGPSGESDYERLVIQTWSAREIVRLMGGTLGISTWADARVVFTLDLPKTSPEPVPHPELP